jgi:uncharacterized damage-inducible protein DinB
MHRREYKVIMQLACVRSTRHFFRVTMNIAKDDIARLFKFHHWATGRVFDALAALSSADLDRKWGGSFGTGRGLLEHIVGSDRVWIERLNGNSPKTRPVYPTRYSGSEFRNEWIEVEAEERRFIGSLTPAQLAKDLSYVNLKGEAFTWPLPDVLFHIVNHGTYHRGQITQLLRDLGKDAPATDFTVFLQT